MCILLQLSHPDNKLEKKISLTTESYLCIFLFEIEMTKFSDGKTFHFDEIGFLAV